MSKKSAPTPSWHTGNAVAELPGESNRAKAAAALAMGTTITTLYRWLREEEWPHRNIEKAAAYFGVSEEWLLFGTGEKYVGPSGGNDPRSRRAEATYMRLEAQIATLLKKYTREIARIYDENAETPPPVTGKRRQWNPNGVEDF